MRAIVEAAPDVLPMATSKMPLKIIPIITCLLVAAWCSEKTCSQKSPSHVWLWCTSVLTKGHCQGKRDEEVFTHLGYIQWIQ